MAEPTTAAPSRRDIRTRMAQELTAAAAAPPVAPQPSAPTTPPRPVSTPPHQQPPPPLIPDASGKHVKVSHVLAPSDVDVIEQQTRLARAAGVRMRKNGNPSLFIRAGLRLLEELRQREPDQWLARIRTVAANDPQP